MNKITKLVALCALTWASAAQAQIYDNGGGGALLGELAGTSTSSVGITPNASASAATSAVYKSAPGNLYAAYATNLTATAGFFVTVNATSAPSTGAITPIDCVPLPASGVASISYSPGPPEVFSTGIVALVTSASSCYTYTTGVITAHFHGSVK